MIRSTRSVTIAAIELSQSVCSRTSFILYLVRWIWWISYIRGWWRFGGGSRKWIFPL